jgi:hypothetical protein
LDMFGVALTVSSETNMSMFLQILT